MRRYGLAISAVGIAFSATECFGETMRGEALSTAFLLLPTVSLGSSLLLCVVPHMSSALWPSSL